MKKKTRILSTLAFGASCVFAGGIATNNSFAIGNAAFEDENFYSCVVKQFNASFPGEITIATPVSDTVLSDAQLAKMDILNCERQGASNLWSWYGNIPSYYEQNGPKATSVAGLEKMTGLRSLYIQGQELGSIDLSKNINLTELSLGWNGLTEIDLSKNVKINHLGIHEQITSFNEPTLTELISANFQNSTLTSIDVSNNKKLRTLLLDNGNPGLKEIDLSNNAELLTLTADSSVRLRVKPYVEISQTDNCELAVKIPLLRLSRTTVDNSEYYTYDNETSTLIFKKRPEEIINSMYFRTVQNQIDQGTVDRIYYIFLPDSVIEAYDNLSSCTPKSTKEEKDIPVPDTASNTTPTSNDSTNTRKSAGVKAPDTGAMTGENNGKIIALSITAIGFAAALGYLAYYAHNRRKNRVKF